MMSHVPSAIAVSTGFTWTSAFTGGTFLTLIALIIRQVGPWRGQTMEANDKLIANLEHRLSVVEAQLETERRRNFVQTARIDARHSAQRAQDRHKFANSESCVDALLLRLPLIIRMPNPAEEIERTVAMVQDMRARFREGERIESATIHAAELAAVAQAETAFETELPAA